MARTKVLGCILEAKEGEGARQQDQESDGADMTIIGLWPFLGMAGLLSPWRISSTAMM